MATWLLGKVGLTPFNVVARFAPFAYRGFETHEISNPHASRTSVVPPEAPPVSTERYLCRTC